MPSFSHGVGHLGPSLGHVHRLVGYVRRAKWNYLPAAISQDTQFYTENRSFLCKHVFSLHFDRYKPVPYLFTIKAGIASLNSAVNTLQSELKIPLGSGPRGPLPPETAHSGIVLSDNFPANWKSCPKKKLQLPKSLGDLWELWFRHRAVLQSADICLRQEGFVQSDNFLRCLIYPKADTE